MSFVRIMGCVALVCRAAGAVPSPVVVHSEQSSMASARTRNIASGSVGGASGTISLTTSMRRSVVVQSPDSETIGIVSLDASASLRLHPLTDSGIGTGVSLASDIASAGAFDAAYLCPSGTLVVAYGVSGSSSCFVRSYNGSLSSAVATPLTLGSTPTRVVVRPRPGPNEVLIVAQDSSSNLAATVWDGTTFRATRSLDTSFDGGSARWDALWTSAGTAMVGWARSSDTAMRLCALSENTWRTVAATPSSSAAIARVEMASDPSTSSASAACLLTTLTGRAEASTYDGSSWSSGTQFTTTLDTTRDRPADLAFEGSGGALVCAWVESGSSTVQTRRRGAGGTWGSVANSGVVGTNIQDVLAAPVKDAAQVSVLARNEMVSAASSGTLSQYVLYTANGGVSTGNRNSYTGLVGSKVAGVSLPSAPGGTDGNNDVTLNHDETQTLSPGSYKDLSFGDRTTINFSAGTYVFRRLKSSGHDAKFVCNTSGGDVTIIFVEKSVEFRDRFRIQRSGSGGISIHVMDTGPLKLGHDGVLEAAFFVYNSNADWGDRNRLTGHLFAKTGIKIGHDGVFATPTTWSIGGGSGVTTQYLYGIVISSGTVGSVTTLTSTGIETTDDVALAASQPPTRPSFRVVRWREMAPE